MSEHYPTQEKLKGKYHSDVLFGQGKWLKAGRLSLIFVHQEALAQSKVGVSAPKKLFKRAHDRNRVKRLLRELYRLNKSVFLQALPTHSLCMLFYNQKEAPKKYQDLKPDFELLCQRLQTRVEEMRQAAEVKNSKLPS
jgi:ribonuclease P protein component